MSSKYRHAGDTASLCRIGERVFLAPAKTDDSAVAAFALRARRCVDLLKDFRVFQMPADFEPLQEHRSALGSDLKAFLEEYGLHGERQTRVLKGLFEVVGRLFRLQADPVFIPLVSSLMRDETLPKATIHIEAVEGCDTALVSIPAQGGFSVGDLLISLTSDRLAVGRIERIASFLGLDNPRQKLATVHFSDPPARGQFMLIGQSGLTMVEAELRSFADLRAFHAHFAGSKPDMSALLTEADEDAAIELNLFARRNTANPAVDEPLLAVRFVADVTIALSHGLFVGGWFYDPEQRIDRVVAIDHGLSDASVSDTWMLFDGRAEILGKIVSVKRFAAFLTCLRKSVAPASVALRVVLKNGESHIIRPEHVPQDLLTQRQRILGSMAGHAFDNAMLMNVYGPALAPIQNELNNRQSVRKTKVFGIRSDRAVSLIIPLYKETGFIRSQLMAFSVDPFIRKHCEILYVLDDPLIELKVVSILEGSAFVFPLDLKLVILERNGGYALANNMGVAESDGETLILMNSDVNPTQVGWVEPALKKLNTLPPFSVIGPKLLYADDTLQHAGMYFYQLPNGYWQNFHYWKGHGCNFAPAEVERVVPAVTGACMILKKADFLDVGGFTADYIVGDYEDSDLCLKLRERNGTPYYMPSIELFHFERQSMPEDVGQQDRGSTIYNRALHSARWSERIANLMAEAKESVHVK